MSKIFDTDESISKINIVPFVDVVLVLLVIFMISAPTIYSQSTQIWLPSIFNAQSSEQITFRLMIKDDGALFLDKKKISAEQLPALYDEATKIDPQVDALVEADKRVSHGQVMEVITKLQELGIENVAIAGQKGSPAKAKKGS